MRVATWRGDMAFTIDEVPEPAPGPGEVLIAVHTAGICGTDVHATQGLFPVTRPRVMGHEYSGVVVDVGKGVGRRLLDRAVACEPNYGCGTCTECRAGQVSQCARCIRIGGFAERPRLEPAGPVLRGAAANDQPGTLQHLQVSGYRRETDREGLGELADRRFSVGEPGENRPPGRVGQRREGRVEHVRAHTSKLLRQ